VPAGQRDPSLQHDSHGALTRLDVAFLEIVAVRTLRRSYNKTTARHDRTSASSLVRSSHRSNGTRDNYVPAILEVNQVAGSDRQSKLSGEAAERIELGTAQLWIKLLGCSGTW
jgi:hypothetical protein